MVAGNRVPAVEIVWLLSPLLCAQRREPPPPRGPVLLPEIFADDFAVRLSPTWPLEQLPQLRLEPCANRRQFSHHHGLTRSKYRVHGSQDGPVQRDHQDFPRAARPLRRDRMFEVGET